MRARQIGSRKAAYPSISYLPVLGMTRTVIRCVSRRGKCPGLQALHTATSVGGLPGPALLTTADHRLTDLKEPEGQQKAPHRAAQDRTAPADCRFAIPRATRCKKKFMSSDTSSNPERDPGDNDYRIYDAAIRRKLSSRNRASFLEQRAQFDHCESARSGRYGNGQSARDRLWQGHRARASAPKGDGVYRLRAGECAGTRRAAPICIHWYRFSLIAGRDQETNRRRTPMRCY